MIGVTVYLPTVLAFFLYVLNQGRAEKRIARENQTAPHVGREILRQRTGRCDPYHVCGEAWVIFQRALQGCRFFMASQYIADLYARSPGGQQRPFQQRESAKTCQWRRGIHPPG